MAVSNRVRQGDVSRPSAIRKIARASSGQPERTLSHDDGVPADLDTLELISTSPRARMQGRWPSDLDPLLDDDLISKPDAAMSSQVHGEWSRGGASRGVLSDPFSRREDATLPGAVVSGKDAECGGPQGGQARQVRPQRRDLVQRIEPNVDVMRTVVVEIHGQRGTTYPRDDVSN